MTAVRAAGLLLCCLLPALPVLPAGPGAESALLVLPPPQTDGGMPLMQALKERHTTREYGQRALPQQLLSNLLWAAFGINRADSGRRTAPSAHDARAITIYVATADGVYIYEPGNNALRLVRTGDIRALTGRQDFVRDAPVNLVYVAELDKLYGDSEADRLFYSAADAGFISQNVYLYCASEGLATMVRAYIDRAALAKTMLLTPRQHIVLAQSIGYPR
jgi:nitroreductase